MTQIECPNCGSNKVRARRFRVDVVNEKRQASLLGMCVLVGSGTFLASTLLAGSIYFYLLSALPGQTVATLSLATSIAVTSIVTALFAQNRYRAAPLTKPAGNFQCTKCGYNWYWSEGHPWPQHRGA
ncbi:MAG TPA: hypothetical protein VJ183_08965 [Chloroflexia bacterium]|nr:hypothetical protein [Chloroflexia bacterium]